MAGTVGENIKKVSGKGDAEVKKNTLLYAAFGCIIWKTNDGKET